MNYKVLDSGIFLETFKSASNPLMIDVREDYEFEEFNLGGVNIPMGTIRDRIAELKGYLELFLCCKSGKRSLAVANLLSNQLNDVKVYSLHGGIDAYLENV